jgi:hypothetical protein
MCYFVFLFKNRCVLTYNRANVLILQDNYVKSRETFIRFTPLKNIKKRVQSHVPKDSKLRRETINKKQELLEDTELLAKKGNSETIESEVTH